MFEIKKNNCIATEDLIWERLGRLGVVAVTSLYLAGKRVRKTCPVAGLDVACKWQKKSLKNQVKAAWFILTNVGSLPAALDAYKQRMGIEEMFRDGVAE